MEQKPERNLIFPPKDYIFDTHTNVQNEFIGRIETEGIDSAIKWLKSIKNSELSYPETLTFVWEGDSGDVFELSESVDFSRAKKVLCSSSSCEIGNFKIATEYFWRINGGKSGIFTPKTIVFAL